MKVKGIIDECVGDYYKTSMYVAMPYCTFKCDKENGMAYCQNSELIEEPDIEISIKELVKRYIDNPLTEAIIFSGLEPLDSFQELNEFIRIFRLFSEDDIVIYTGYTEQEILNKFQGSSLFREKNIIIKCGRFRPNQKPHYDEILGVHLASDNQYAVRYNSDKIL